MIDVSKLPDEALNFFYKWTDDQNKKDAKETDKI